MQRRSFIQSLLAIPVVALASRFMGQAAPSRKVAPAPLPRQSVAMLPVGEYKKFRAGTGIRKGSMVREFQFGDGVVPMDSEPGGWFVGVTMHDAMEGDMVIVMTEGIAPVRFQ